MPLLRRSFCACLLWCMCLPAALADQNAAELPALFEELAQAATAADAQRIESRIWQLWLKAPDKNSGLLLSQIGEAMRHGELELALRLGHQLVDSQPDFAEAWNKRATIYYLLGDASASVLDIRQTLALEPRHFGAISGLGLIFVRQEEFQSALDAFRQVLLISPASASAKRSIEQVRQLIEREI